MSRPVVPNGLARVAATALAAAAVGCAGTRSFTIPPATPAFREPTHPVPVGLGLYFPIDVPGRVASHEVNGAEGPTKYLLPIGDAVVDTYSALLPRLFERVERVHTPEPPPSSDLAGVLEVDLGKVELAIPSAFETGPCQVSVEESFTLRDRQGAVVGVWKASGSGEEPRGAVVQCGGPAASAALSNAAEGFVRGFSDEPGVHAWLASQGMKSLPVESPGELRLASESESTAVPESSPVRVFGVYGGGGYFLPAADANLQSPKGGLALLFGWTWRPISWVGLNLEAQNLSSSYATSPTSALTRISLNQTVFAPTARFSWPVSVVEPWASLGPVVDLAYLNGIPSGSSQSNYQTRFLVGALVAAGLDFVVTPTVEVGARWQWLFAYADFDALSSSSVPVGGQAVTLTGGYFWP